MVATDASETAFRQGEPCRFRTNRSTGRMRRPSRIRSASGREPHASAALLTGVGSETVFRTAARLATWATPRNGRSSGAARPPRPSTTSPSPASRSRPPSRTGSAGSRPPPRARTPTSACSTPTSRERIADGRRPHRRGRVRRPVPDRRLPDRLGDELEHERQRGDRDARRRGRPPERPRQHGPVVERRVPVGRAPRRARPRRQRAAAGARAARRTRSRARRRSSTTSSSPGGRT